MIGFFRRVRKKLADDNQFLKYSRYAIGETLLVVIGILIALQINNWNQEQINIKKEQTALNNLILDLEEQSSIIEVYLAEEDEFYKSGLYISEHYAKNKNFIINDTLLSKFNILGFRRTFNPVNTTFNELVSTGNIGLIRNEKLKRAIMRFFNELERISLVTSYNNTNLIDGLYNPVLFQQTVFIHKFAFGEDQYNRLLNILREDQKKIFKSGSLENLYATSGKILLTPERALHLFNLVQIRTQMASGQVIRYTELREEINKLLEAIKSYTI